MMKEVDTDASGYLYDAYEGLGQTFSEWEELRRNGGFFVARAKRYGRWWVVKGLLPDYEPLESHRQMLRKEFEVMMMLQHPMVVQAVALEPVDGHGTCIVMEYVSGTRLDHWLENDKPDVAERRRMASLLLDVVAYVHGNGIVHRDIKPLNILVTAGGASLKLIDYGVADTVSHAVLKQPAGTVGYMSPEQMSLAVPDVRNDIYSLGMVMRQMALGRRYNSVIARCLSPIDHRYDNMAALRQAFDAVERNRRRWLLAALIAAVMSLGAAMAWLATGAVRPGASGVSTAVTDSLRQHLAAQQQAQHSMSDSMTRLAADNQRLQAAVDRQQQQQSGQERQQTAERRQKVENAIARGKRAIDTVAARCAINANLDSLTGDTRTDERLLDDGLSAIRGAAVDYLASIKRDFTPDEMATIQQACENRLNYHATRWLTKINSR